MDSNYTFTTRVKFTLLLIITVFLNSNFSIAREYQHNQLLINHPYATPTRPGINNGVMYIISIKNSSQTEDELTNISTEIAKTSEIHSMENEDGTMKMRKISSIKLPSKKTVSIKKGNPKGFHIMLFELTRKLHHGDIFNATLHFKNSPSLKVNVEVMGPKDAHQH